MAMITNYVCLAMYYICFISFEFVSDNDNKIIVGRVMAAFVLLNILISSLMI